MKYFVFVLEKAGRAAFLNYKEKKNQIFSSKLIFKMTNVLKIHVLP